MYYLEEKKKVFNYKINNIKHYDTTEEYMVSIGLSNEEVLNVKKKEVAFNKHLCYHENRWRNQVLMRTDWIMIEDAVLGGVDIRETEQFEEAKAYRKAVRLYANNPIGIDRPVRPSWIRLNN